jgi:hypothetical protein
MQTNFPPCKVCRSTNYHLNGVVYICESGHELAGYLWEESEEVGAHGVARRGVKLRKIKKLDPSLVEQEGKEGEVTELRIPAHLVSECFQECLKYQTKHLIREKDLPSELLGLVLDLWMMLATRMPMCFAYDVEKEGDVGYIFDDAGSRVKLSDLHKPEHRQLNSDYYNKRDGKGKI